MSNDVLKKTSHIDVYIIYRCVCMLTNIFLRNWNVKIFIRAWNAFTSFQQTDCYLESVWVLPNFIVKHEFVFHISSEFLTWARLPATVRPILYWRTPSTPFNMKLGNMPTFYHRLDRLPTRNSIHVWMSSMICKETILIIQKIRSFSE